MLSAAIFRRQGLLGIFLGRGSPSIGLGQGPCSPTRLRHILFAMSDSVTRLNAALQGRCEIERELVTNLAAELAGN